MNRVMSLAMGAARHGECGVSGARACQLARQVRRQSTCLCVDTTQSDAFPGCRRLCGSHHLINVRDLRESGRSRARSCERDHIPSRSSALRRACGATTSVAQRPTSAPLRPLLSYIAMGAAGSMLEPPLIDAPAVASALFQREAPSDGLLPVDHLVDTAYRYFQGLPTSQPEKWIRSVIEKQDDDRDGLLSEVQFTWAVEDLKKC